MSTEALAKTDPHPMQEILDRVAKAYDTPVTPWQISDYEMDNESIMWIGDQGTCVRIVSDENRVCVWRGAKAGALVTRYDGIDRSWRMLEEDLKQLFVEFCVDALRAHYVRDLQALTKWSLSQSKERQQDYYRAGEALYGFQHGTSCISAHTGMFGMIWIAGKTMITATVAPESREYDYKYTLYIKTELSADSASGTVVSMETRHERVSAGRLARLVGIHGVAPEDKPTDTQEDQ